MASQWYYIIDEVQYGPVSSDELRILTANKTIKPNDLIKKHGLEEWVKAETVKGLYELEEYEFRTKNNPIASLCSEIASWYKTQGFTLELFQFETRCRIIANKGGSVKALAGMRINVTLELEYSLSNEILLLRIANDSYSDIKKATAIGFLTYGATWATSAYGITEMKKSIETIVCLIESILSTRRIVPANKQTDNTTILKTESIEIDDSPQGGIDKYASFKLATRWCKSAMSTSVQLAKEFGDFFRTKCPKCNEAISPERTLIETTYYDDRVGSAYRDRATGFLSEYASKNCDQVQVVYSDYDLLYRLKCAKCGHEWQDLDHHSQIL